MDSVSEEASAPALAPATVPAPATATSAKLSVGIIILIAVAGVIFLLATAFLIKGIYDADHRQRESLRESFGDEVYVK
jgi:hypothetical protein